MWVCVTSCKGGSFRRPHEVSRPSQTLGSLMSTAFDPLRKLHFVAFPPRACGFDSCLPREFTHAEIFVPNGGSSQEPRVSICLGCALGAEPEWKEIPELKQVQVFMSHEVARWPKPAASASCWTRSWNGGLARDCCKLGLSGSRMRPGLPRYPRGPLQRVLGVRWTGLLSQPGRLALGKPVRTNQTLRGSVSHTPKCAGG